MTSLPDFKSTSFLLDHIRSTMAFYHPRAIDPSGGFYHFFLDDGTIYDHHTRHLVSSTRFVFNYSMAYRHFGDPAYKEVAYHGVCFLEEAHKNPVNGGYAWQINWQDGARIDVDNTNHCYGLAFVLLAYAHALMAGIETARPLIAATYELMEKHFWEPQYGLYADQANVLWQVDPYRGQNANMHTCEALLAAYEASNERRYLDRAQVLAENITQRQAALADGLIWEHYHADWSVDWDYNKNDKTNIFRPWGYQPGHLTEWAKLLLILERHRPSSCLVSRAEAFFNTALQNAWDEKYGGIYYGFAPDRRICDADKYFWVQAESLAAAARLAQRTGKKQYWDWYERIWRYSWEHLVDHRYGAWYRALSEKNFPYSNEKSPAGKTDYHTMGACYDVLNIIKE